MKALTLQQPYATLGALGLKQWETRSKPTKFRGEHLITASATPQAKFSALIREPIYIQQIDANPDLEIGKLMFGGIVGKATISDCLETTEAKNFMLQEVADGRMSKEQYDMNIAFGDWSPGRYAYKWVSPTLFENPIPCKGALGLFETSKIKGNYAVKEIPNGMITKEFRLYYLGEETGLWAKTEEIMWQTQAIMSDIDERIYAIEKRLFKL